MPGRLCAFHNQAVLNFTGAAALVELTVDGDTHTRQAEVDGALLARLREQKASGRMRTDVPDDVLRVYLDIVLDGLITHLATGRGTEHVSEMLDLVEASLRTGRD